MIDDPNLDCVWCQVAAASSKFIVRKSELKSERAQVSVNQGVEQCHKFQNKKADFG